MNGFHIGDMLAQLLFLGVIGLVIFLVARSFRLKK